MGFIVPQGHHNRSQRERFHSALRAEFHLATAKLHPPQVDFIVAVRRHMGGDCMVTYSELFQFVMMLTAVIALILQVCNYKKK